MSEVSLNLQVVSKTDFLIGICVVGAACGVLLVIVIGLIIWNWQLSKKIKKLDPFVNFRLQRPRMYQEQTQAPIPEPPKNPYDNPAFFRANQHEEKRDLNPIAQRTSASMDNGNFIFGNPNRETNSFRGRDYLDQDSRFY